MKENTMKAVIRDMKDTDGPSITAIFNYFAVNSFAAYTDKEREMEVFYKFKANASVFLVLEIEEKTVGFGLIQPYLPHENCRHTGMLTYFILPEYTHKGFGSKILEKLIELGKEKGITNLLAHISSKNTQSLEFHKKHGFHECGRFRNIGIKFNEPFDAVWVQRSSDVVS
jgi:L-amino acid N-acyltransferase YncA